MSSSYDPAPFLFSSPAGIFSLHTTSEQYQAATLDPSAQPALLLETWACCMSGRVCLGVWPHLPNMSMLIVRAMASLSAEVGSLWR